VRRGALALLIVLAGCQTVTVTPEPIATLTPSATMTVQPSWTPTRSYTATSTPPPSSTPTAAPTCIPPYADLTILTCIESNDDGMCNLGSETPISATVLLTYQGLTSPGQPYKLMESVSTGVRGLWGGPVLAGIWLIHVQGYDAPPGGDHLVAPSYDNPSVLALSIGDTAIVSLVWGDFRPPVPTFTVAPIITPIPTRLTPTPTITPHACKDYAINCKPSCGAGEAVDIGAGCAPGMVCCKVTP